MEKYYVYFWFNIDSFEIFYIGMGHGDRRFNIKKRSTEFKEYYRSNRCTVRIYESGLEYDEARQLEVKLIEKYNPCCNKSSGGERTNAELISKKLKGRKLSESHKKNLSKAAKKQWRKNPIKSICKEVIVLDKNKEIVKRFDRKYKVEEWFYEQGYASSKRTAQRILAPYFKSKELWSNRYYFILEKEYNSFIS